MPCVSCMPLEQWRTRQHPRMHQASHLGSTGSHGLPRTNRACHLRGESPAQLVVLADLVMMLGFPGPVQVLHLGSESPAQLVVLADPVIVVHDEREGVLRMAGHQQLEPLMPHRVPRGIGNGALQLAVRAQVQPACNLHLLGVQAQACGCIKERLVLAL